MRFASRFSGSLFVASLVALTSVFTAADARAQSANFLGVTTTLAGGMSLPYGAALDSAGNVYIADTYNNLILKVPYNAGSYGSPSALVYGLHHPTGVAVDVSGNVFIVDSGNSALKELPYTAGSYGQIITVYSDFQNAFGIALDASGNVFVSEIDSSDIKEFPNSGGTYGAPVTLSTGSFQPGGIALDSRSNLYFLDMHGGLNKLPYSGAGYGAATVVASGFNDANGVTLDAYDNIYVADTDNRVVKMLPYVSGSYGTPVLLGAGLAGPSGIVVTATGDIIVTDYIAGVTYKIASVVNLGSAAVATSTPLSQTLYFNTGTISSGLTPVALTQGTSGLDFSLGSALSCSANPYPSTLTTCSVVVNFVPKAPGQRQGAVELLDSSNNVLATAFLSGIGTGPAITFPSNTTTTPIGGNSFNEPSGVAVDAAGNVYVADFLNQAVEKIPYSAGSYGTPITVSSNVDGPTGVAVDGAGNVYVADFDGGSVYKIPYSAGSYGTPISLASGSFSAPNGIAVDALGNVYVADLNNSVIDKIPYTAGGYSSPVSVGAGFNQPAGVAVDAAGSVYVADSSNGALKKISYNGSSYGPPVTLASQLATPYGVAVDIAGDVYIGTYGSQVELLPYSGGSYGTPITIGNGFNVPSGVAVDASGNVFVADNGNNAITITPLATPPVLLFANTALNGSSAPQTVTVSNVGNAALTLPIPSSGQNPSISANYTLANASTCPISYSTSPSAATIATGTSCTEQLTYTPVSNGATTGNLVFTDNQFSATNAEQAVIMTGTTALALTMEVIGQNVAAGTSSITLEFIVGYGGNAAPTTTPTLTVNGTAANVGAVSCLIKAGHNNCTAPYNPSSLTPGTYTITATQPADSTYTTPTTASAILTILGNTSHITKPILQTGTVQPAATTTTPTPTANATRIRTQTAAPAAMPYILVAPSFNPPTPGTTTDDADTTKKTPTN